MLNSQSLQLETIVYLNVDMKTLMFLQTWKSYKLPTQIDETIFGDGFVERHVQHLKASTVHANQHHVVVRHLQQRTIDRYCKIKLTDFERPTYLEHPENLRNTFGLSVTRTPESK